MWMELWSVLLELSPWLVLGAAIAGVLHVALPPDFLRRRLQGPRGVAQSVVLGVPLPLCSCSVIPAGIGLKRDGASDGSAVAFLISTPQTGLDSIFVSASFLGWPFAIFKVFSAAITGLVGGWLCDLTPDREQPSESAVATHEHPRTVREAVRHAIDVMRSIWLWLVFGIVASAAINAYVPPEFFASIADWFGEGGAIFAVLIASVPLYVCATASVPIAAAMVAGGLPTSAALVFLMAGPATNAATIGSIYRTFGSQRLMIYLLTIIVGSVGFGLTFDFLLPTVDVGEGHAMEHSTPWAVASSIGFLALLGYFAFETVQQKLSRSPLPTEAALVLPVHGMTCGGCVSRLERALGDTEGVIAARVDLDLKQATVESNLQKEAVIEVIVEAGFSVPSQT